MSGEDRPTALVIDDDRRFADTLAAALSRAGWDAQACYSIAAARDALTDTTPDAAIVDLRIGHDDGLTLVPQLREVVPGIRIIVLTGYASITTAVRAVKLGADDYLAKPVTAASVVSTLRRGESEADTDVESAGAGADSGAPLPMSPRRLEWEHIQRVLAEHDGNISATARALNMHRRTLQRKLSKRPTRY
jgi:two-component system, response regulator RegA